MFNAQWYTQDGSASSVATDPQWKALFNWQHDFIANVYGGGDFQTGSDRVQRFVAGAGNEFSSAQTSRPAARDDDRW